VFKSQRTPKQQEREYKFTGRSHTSRIWARAREFICQRAAKERAPRNASHHGRRHVAPSLDWQASTQSAGWLARARRERTQRREHVAARCLRRLLHAILERGDGSRRVRRCLCLRPRVLVCGCGELCKRIWNSNPQIASYLSHQTNTDLLTHATRQARSNNFFLLW